ncbi:hypothetical protein BGW38_009032, partial [Lunasporangiospora selenospora]
MSVLPQLSQLSQAVHGKLGMTPAAMEQIAAHPNFAQMQIAAPLVPQLQPQPQPQPQPQVSQPFLPWSLLSNGQMSALLTETGFAAPARETGVMLEQLPMANLTTRHDTLQAQRHETPTQLPLGSQSEQFWPMGGQNVLPKENDNNESGRRNNAIEPSKQQQQQQQNSSYESSTRQESQGSSSHRDYHKRSDSYGDDRSERKYSRYETTAGRRRYEDNGESGNSSHRRHVKYSDSSNDRYSGRGGGGDD